MSPEPGSNDADDRGLAGTIGPKQPEEITGRDLEINIMQGGNTAGIRLVELTQR